MHGFIWQAAIHGTELFLVCLDILHQDARELLGVVYLKYEHMRLASGVQRGDERTRHHGGIGSVYEDLVRPGIEIKMSFHMLESIFRLELVNIQVLIIGIRYLPQAYSQILFE